MDTIMCKKCKAVLPTTFKYCPNCGAPTTAPPPVTRRRKRGSGSVYKIKGNRSKPWVVKVKGIIIGVFAEQSEAEHYLAEKQGIPPELINFTLEMIYERVKTSPAFKKLAQSSQKNLELAWKKLDPIKSQKIRNLKTTDYQKIIDAAAENGTGRDGCAKLRTLISMLCQNAMLDDIIIRDYAEGLTLPDKEIYVKRRNFTEEEILTLFYNDEDRVARIVLIMIYSALRLGELFNIRKEDVHLENRYMIGGEKTDAGRDRIIPIKEEIFPYILDFMNQPGEYLICSITGKHMHESNFRVREFYPLLDRLGFDYKDELGRNMLTPHRTRHTYISESIAAGVKPEVLRLVVGHASYKTSVETYGKEAQLDVLQSEVKKSF